MHFNDYRRLGFTTIANGLIAYYSRLKITDAELILILQLEAFSQHGESFPSNEKLAANTNLSVREIGSLIQRLIDQKLLEIKQTTDEKGRIGNCYSLDPLYERLDQYLKDHVVSKTIKKTNSSSNTLDNNPLAQVTREFEIEFGRYLSPIEREEIQAWLEIDHYRPGIISLALREAVLSQVYNLKYVDRILLNWQRRNLKTSSEVKRYLQRNR